MFGQAKPVVFESYGSRRSRWRVPRWLVLLVGGVAIGGGGTVLVQERYLPPRLSADASENLRIAYEQADAERQKRKSELGDTSKQLAAALADKKSLADELAASRVTVERLREDVASVVVALPPDPRGGVVEVRAGRIKAQGALLAYDVVFTRDNAAGKPMAGVMQIVVAGDAARGGEATVTLAPVALSVGSYEILRGTLELPEGFRPRQATIRVLDNPTGRSLGMRVLPVK